MDTDAGKLIFLHRLAPKLKAMVNDDSLKELKKKLKQKTNKKKAKKVTTTQTLTEKLKNKHKIYERKRKMVEVLRAE